jgi:hypothetical protein
MDGKNHKEYLNSGMKDNIEYYINIRGLSSEFHNSFATWMRDIASWESDGLWARNKILYFL